MTGQIRKIQKMSNSVMGNPCFRLWILTDEGMLIVRTKANISDAYAITGGWVGKDAEFEQTKSGTINKINLI